MLQDINQYHAAKARQILEYFHAKRVLITGGFGFVGGHMPAARWTAVQR